MVKAILFAFLTLLSSYATYNAALINNDVDSFKNESIYIEKEIMSISIPKLNINNKIYNVESDLNNIDKNIIILKGSNMPNKENGILLIGAHSGFGKYAYFKNLDKLKMNDEVIINYNNNSYSYRVIDKYLDRKDGSITFNSSPTSKRLILYTCNPNDKDNYLVVVCEP